MKIKLSEAQVKKACEDLLTILQNQGKLVWLRLNSGDFIEARGDTRRRVRGCPKGTADLIVIRCFMIPSRIGDLSCHVITPDVVFIELKSSTGRQSPEQKDFQHAVEKQGCTYYIIRDAEELEAILK